MTLTLGLENISLALQVMATASRPRLDKLYADQLQRPECLATCTRDAATPGTAPVSVLKAALGLNVPTFAAAAGGGLQSDLAALLETTGGALLSGATASADTLVAGAAGLARERLNKEIGAYMDQAPPCPALSAPRLSNSAEGPCILLLKKSAGR
ncbi:unnamed protein product [Prorocentrum cordatum]|uniref:Uncharacterized protein n=1 Tax=Prorocentrum cordatum TaxID=2364126 RepID=A0ABN9S097_9DINO|nr:unnamed protein product [Polarella glacialis]